MQSFSDKGTNETLTYTVGFINLLEPGVSITSANVTASVSDQSDISDPNPGAIIAGAAQINSEVAVVNGISIPIGQAVLQSVTGGLLGCSYILTFDAITDGLENINEQVGLFISEYVPTP